ncbi:hypothetical protein GN956_G467 [Arapaima gigas]
MAQGLKALFCHLLIVAVCADAVRAYNSVPDKYELEVPDAGRSTHPWNEGVVSSQLEDHHRVLSNGPFPVEPFHEPEDDGTDVHDLSEEDDADLLDYDSFNPRGHRLQKGEKGHRRPVAVKPLPDGPQSRGPSSISQTEDARHPTKPKEMGISQSHARPSGVDRPVSKNLAPLKAAGTHHVPSTTEQHVGAGIASRRPAVAKPAPGNWMLSRHEPGVFHHSGVLPLYLTIHMQVIFNQPSTVQQIELGPMLALIAWSRAAMVVFLLQLTAWPKASLDGLMMAILAGLLVITSLSSRLLMGCPFILVYSMAIFLPMLPTKVCLMAQAQVAISPLDLMMLATMAFSQCPLARLTVVKVVPMGLTIMTISSLPTMIMGTDTLYRAKLVLNMGGLSFPKLAICH